VQNRAFLHLNLPETPTQVQKPPFLHLNPPKTPTQVQNRAFLHPNPPETPTQVQKPPFLHLNSAVHLRQAFMPLRPKSEIGPLPVRLTANFSFLAAPCGASNSRHTHAVMLHAAAPLTAQACPHAHFRQRRSST